MVTIQNLEVRFDVEGQGDEKAFADLFNKYINEWSRRHDEQQRLQRRIQKDSLLGDHRNPEEY
jgi:Txe/YoeB family toxin of Txe-Axe toxin-antitoxin module